ncbi:hypothetical protein [Sphingopyxis chilensis]
MTGRSATTIFFLLAGLACSSCSDLSEDRDEREREHIPGSDPDAIGRHIYACNDGRNYSVDLFEDGLTVDLSPPDDKPMRLAAFSQGMTYVGAGITARISGLEMQIERADRPALRCRRK